ncbi:TPA: hypothetical protein QDB45_001650 [Burkholderia vietnamiensis]|nr:hypothetical protein [Burkholderia vietnamiensis]
MGTTHHQHTYRFPYGQDPEINEILRLDLADRTTPCITSFVRRGMDVHDLLQKTEFYRDPHHQVEPDVVALLKAALPFTTPEGLNATSDEMIAGNDARMAVWAMVVCVIQEQTEGSMATIETCVNLLADAGARLDEFTDADATFIGFIDDQTVVAIRRVAVERERVVFNAEVGSVVEQRSAGRRRL